MSIILPNGENLRRDYRVFYADPAWTFVTRSARGKGRSPEQHYSCMSIDEIKALPVATHAADDSALFLWTTDPHLELAFEVLKAWDYKYVTVGLYWVKRNKNAEPRMIMSDNADFSDGIELWSDDQFFTGMGYYGRCNPELCLLGVRGNPKRLNRDVRKLIVSRRREHSRKPDEAYPRIERLFAGPYLEMFARTARPGWDAWGDQVGRFSAA